MSASAAATAGTAQATVSAAMQGDRGAAAALWAEHRRWIAAVLLAYMPRGADVDDLLQEVAMTLVCKVTTLREHEHIRAWLRTVAINVARAAGRRERARPVLRLTGLEEESSHRLTRPCESVHSDADAHAARVLELTMRLPDTYREPLLLKAVHGMRSRQIGELLGIPEATVDTRVSRARRMLREQVTLHVADGEHAGAASVIASSARHASEGGT